MTDVDREDMLVWVYQRQKTGLETSWSDLETYFGPWGGIEDMDRLGKRYKRLEDYSLRKYMLEQLKIKRCAKQTFMNYKNQLEAAGKLKKRISERTGRPIYYVPEEYEKEVRLLIDRQKLMGYVGNADEEEIERLKIVYEMERSKNKELRDTFRKVVEIGKRDKTLIEKLIRYAEKLEGWYLGSYDGNS